MKTVVVIDDDELYQLVLKRSIKKSCPDVEVISFWNGEDGLNGVLEIINNGSEMPACIFLDINMPVLDGWQFLQELEEKTDNIEERVPIYLFSSSLDPNDKERARACKLVRSMLIKPLTIDTMKQIIG